jgi:hypothetical protein
VEAAEDAKMLPEDTLHAAGMMQRNIISGDGKVISKREDVQKTQLISC